VAGVTGDLVEDPSSSSPAASAVSSKVEAQGVEARRGEVCRQRLVFERVKAEPAEHHESRCVVGAVPQPSVEVQLSRREADRLGVDTKEARCPMRGQTVDAAPLGLPG
jgi:hypothetical protein